ncbi:DUF6882 domain-containing protein [Streptomyces virginiae]|uniref:DUF6882 domain-containing protein n=1 Tax=Streptomyces virginiae TaxID=1961 RepID=UPI0022540436|nr:DUF6882 domain-containing protein [Streptomyces virginiae]MCX5174185.1 hypothetical protein [Streptomyces virginiae]
MITRFGDPFLSETERHTAWGVAQLEALGSFLPEGPWTADLPSCLYRQGTLELRVSVLGTYDAEERSWMWGWANPGLQGTEVVALSAAVERYGRAHGIAELTAPTLDLSGFPDPRRAAETLAFAGMGVAQAPGYIGVPAGSGTQVYFLPDDPQVPQAPLDPVALPRILVAGAGLIGHSPRLAVMGFFDHYGLPVSQTDRSLTAELPGGSPVNIQFDALDRIAEVTLNSLS